MPYKHIEYKIPRDKDRRVQIVLLEGIHNQLRRIADIKEREFFLKYGEGVKE